MRSFFFGPFGPALPEAAVLLFEQGLADGREALPLGEGIPRKGIAAADLAHRTVGIQHADDLVSVVDQYIIFGVAALAPSENLPFGLAQGQRLLGPHRNQVALDLRDEPEGETEHLAVDAVVEDVALLGRVEVDLLLQAFSHDGHDVGQRPAQARYLRNDQRIARFQSLEQCAQFAVALLLAAAYDLRNPVVDRQIPALGEPADLVLLIGKMLFARAYP